MINREDSQGSLKAWVSRDVGTGSKAQIEAQLPKVTQHVHLFLLQSRIIASKPHTINSLVGSFVKVVNSAVGFKVVDQLEFHDLFEANPNAHLQIFELASSGMLVHKLDMFGWIRSVEL